MEQPTFNVDKLVAGLKRAVTHNIWLKLISFILAFTLWFGVTGGPKQETTISLRLDLSSQIPDGWALAENYTRDIDVRLSGRNNVIQRLINSEEARSEIFISLPATRIQASSERQSIRISQDDIFARGIDVLQVNPEVILLSLDQKITTNKAIELNIAGNIPDGFQLHDDIEIRPPLLNVTGAKARVDQVFKVFANLNLDSIPISQPERISRRLELERDPLLQYELSEIEVILDVVEISEKKRLNIRSYRFTGIDEDTEAVSTGSRQYTWEVTGPKSWIDTLTAETVFMSIDLSNAPRGENHTIDLTPEMLTYDMPYERPELVQAQLISRTKTVTVIIRAK